MFGTDIVLNISQIVINAKLIIICNLTE